MKLRTYIRQVLCAVIMTSTPSFAQKAITKKQWKTTARIVYSCNNHSVIDNYKANYTITADKENTQIDVYLGREFAGTVITESSPQMFNALKDCLKAQQLGSIPEEKVGIVPMGGDFESIKCFAEGADEAFYDAYTTGGVGTMSIKGGSPVEAFELVMPVSSIVEEFKHKKRQEEEAERNRLRKDIRQVISQSQWEATTRAVYNFTDSSTPPEYHRSYSISICEDSITVEVTCYGERLLHKSFPFTHEQFEAVKKELAEQGISQGKEKEEPVGPGGTTDALSFYKVGEEKPYFSAYSYKGVGTLYIEKGNAATVFEKALPEDIETIVAGTRNM